MILFLDAPTVLYGRIVGPQQDLASVEKKNFAYVPIESKGSRSSSNYQ